MQVMGYIRVSTDEQAKDGVGLAVQEEKITAYAKLKGWALADLICDEGASAKNLKRPGMARLLAGVHAGAVDVVIVSKLDRLSRSVRDIYDLVALFERRGVALVSVQESLDATTAMGRAMIGMFAVMSQLEREQISERTAAAMQHLKAAGRVYCRPAFGQRPDDAATLAAIRRWRQRGWTYEAIADELTRRGVPTVRGGRWRDHTVRQIWLRATGTPATRRRRSA